MIYLYSGTPGSGKSLHMAKDIRLILSQGGLIIANFKLQETFLNSKKNKGKVVYLPDVDLTYPTDVAALIEYWVARYPGKRILLCLDECQNIFNARTWNIRGRSDWIQFFALHRHLSKEKCNVILATQDDTSLDKQIRKKIECDYRHLKMKNGGIAFWILSMFFGGNLFKYRVYWYGQRQFLYSELYVANKKLFGVYDTHASFGEDVTEEKMMERAAALLGELPSDEEPEAVTEEEK